MRWGRKQEPQMTREQSLVTRPVRNPAVKTDEGKDGGLTLIVPIDIRHRFRLLVWLSEKLGHKVMPRERRVELDVVGRKVWELIDGKRKMRDIARVVQREYRMPKKEAEHSVGLFLKMLAERRLIALDISAVPGLSPKHAEGQA